MHIYTYVTLLICLCSIQFVYNVQFKQFGKHRLVILNINLFIFLVNIDILIVFDMILYGYHLKIICRVEILIVLKS